MVEFVAIISFIAGVLQIILFFKVWGMTNDIRELKEDHFNEINMADPYQKVNFARINLILGNKEKVKYMLLNDFITNVDQNYTNKEDSIRPYIDNLKKQFGIIGEELPGYINKMETFRDFYELFITDDFIVNKESK